MPPPALWISRYDLPWLRRSNSWAREPAKTRCVWGSTSPGVTSRPPASTTSSPRNCAVSSARAPAKATRPLRTTTAASRTMPSSPPPEPPPAPPAQVTSSPMLSTRMLPNMRHAWPLRRGKRERFVVPGVGVAQDAHRRIVRQHALEPPRRRVGAVGDDDDARVLRVAHADAAAVVHADPRGARGAVDERVQEDPVADGVRSVAHRLGLAVGRRHRSRIEVVASDDDGRLDLPRLHQLVERQSRARALAVAEPSDARRKPLELHVLRRHGHPQFQMRIAGKQIEYRLVRNGDVGRISRERGPAERPFAFAEKRADISGNEPRNIAESVDAIALGGEQGLAAQ